MAFTPERARRFKAAGLAALGVSIDGPEAAHDLLRARPGSHAAALRALDAARASGDTGRVVDGIELIRREFLKVLERHGVTRYSALGARFDPNQHEAIARIVSVDTEPDTVVSETVPGYSLRGRVIRPAQVAVAAAPDENAA